jgi:2-hydroxy-4-carboxymuconate semialdehyde hemiacetal dehydrogenase
MNVGILGYGSIARSHARAIQALQAADARQPLALRAVMGRLREPTDQFAAELGMALATTNLDELLADPSVDAVVICSPTDMHAEQTERALRAGKHVLCEIPLATSLGDTDRLRKLADEVGRRLMVCHTQRFYAPLIEARRLIASGELHAHSIVSRYGFQRRANVNWMGRQRSWTDNLIWHHGCHAVDAALWMLGVADSGETVEVSAQVALPGAALGIPMDLTIAMRTARDQVGTIAMSYNTHIPIHDYLVIGEENTIVYVDGELRDKERVLVPKPDGQGADDPIARQDAEFFDAVRRGREPAVSGHSVRAAMAALQTVQDVLDARLAELGSDARHPLLP